MNNHEKQLLQYEIKLSELKVIGCNLQKLIQGSIDLSISVVDKNIIFNKIKNIFLAVNIIFIEISSHSANINLSLNIFKIRKSIKIIKKQVQDQFVYLTILKKIQHFLFITFRYAHKKWEFIILNNINIAITHLNPETFLLDVGLTLPSIDSNIKMQSLHACINKLELFLITEFKQPNYYCDFNDLITIANLLNIYYICLKIFKNYQEQLKVYSFSIRYFLNSSYDIKSPEKAIEYIIIENNSLLKLNLIKTDSTIHKYKIKLNKVIWLINFKLNNNLYVKNWGTMRTSYTLDQAKNFSKQFISEIYS